MPVEIIVAMENRPGTLADLGETLAKARINVQLVGFAVGSEGVVHLIADDPDTAMGVLKDAGFAVKDRRDVLEVTLPDVPGSLGKTARRLADAGVNVDTWYIVGGDAKGLRCIIGVDDLETAKANL